MKNKSNVIIICSVIIGVCAAIATTLLLLQHLKRSKSKLEKTDLLFENDFDEENEELGM